jgi:hypothetical protein
MQQWGIDVAIVSDSLAIVAISIPAERNAGADNGGLISNPVVIFTASLKATLPNSAFKATLPSSAFKAILP